MRTQQEIIDRISYISKRDFFGFESTDLMCALDFENAKPFLKDEPKVTKEQWESPEEDGTTSRTDGGVRKQIVDYLVFAFGKALDHRGPSSSAMTSFSPSPRTTPTTPSTACPASWPSPRSTHPPRSPMIPTSRAWVR